MKANEEVPKKRRLIETVKAFIRLLHYTRYSVLFGLVLVGLAVVPINFTSTAVKAAYLQTSRFRIFNLTWLSILAAGLVVQTFRVTICNAKGRFDDWQVYRFWDDPPEWLWKLRSVSVWLLALPMPFMCVLISIGAFSESASLLQRVLPWVEFLLGVAYGSVILCIIDIVNRWLLTPNLHDPRMFVLDYRFLFGRRESPRRWQRNANSDEAKQRPVSRKTIAWIRFAIRLLRKVGFDKGYVHKLSLWVKSSPNDQQEPELEEHEVFLPGHVMLAMLCSVLLAAYVVSFYLVQQLGRYPDENRAFGTLFYLVGLIMMLTGGLNALAFFVDRYRIPAGILLVGILAIVSFYPGVAPHQFQTAPAPKYVSTNSSKDDQKTDTAFEERPVTIKQVVDGWAMRQKSISPDDPNRTFVVVTASGGGIQAAAWTSQVLTGMHTSLGHSQTKADDGASEQDGRRFTGAVGFVSGVSGGSVGTLQYIAKYADLCKGTNPKLVAEHIQDMSARSSLESVGWGLLFPDAMRVIGLNRSPYQDRGLVQENLWASRMSLAVDYSSIPSATSGNDVRSADETPCSDWRLGHLGSRIISGELPAVVFNSYAVNTGQRIMISPVRFGDSWAENSRESKAQKNQTTFMRLEYAGAFNLQLRLATAARLSATFPYVTPTAASDRPVCDSEREQLTRSQIVLRDSHFADGGITDNEGLQTAMEFIKELRLHHALADDRPSFDRILLLRVFPFPVTKQSTDKALAAITNVERDRTWRQTLLGPVIALYNGRSGSQQERGAQDVANLLERSKNADFLPESAKRANPSEVSDEASGEVETKRNLEVAVVMADFRYDATSKKTPPLSWKLGPSEKEDVKKAWTLWCEETRQSKALSGSQEETKEGSKERTQERPTNLEHLRDLLLR